MQDLTPQEIIARDRSRLAAALQTGVVQNPDEEAGLRREAQQRGMDPEVLRTARAQRTPLPPPALSTWYDMPERAPRAAGFLSNPQNAAIAHDDTDNLSLAEQTMGVLKNIGGSLYAGLPRTSAGIVGFFEAAEDVSDAVLGAPFRGVERLLGTNVGERNRQFTRQQRGDYRRYLMESAAAARPQVENPIEQAAYSGVESIVPSALGVLTGIIAGPGAGAAVIAAPTGGEAYGRARDQGKALAPALAYGGAQGSAEFLGERIGLGPLLGGLKMGSPFLQTFVKSQIAEQVGEQATTVLQDFTDYAMLNPDQTFAEFLAERPDAALQTAVATAVGSGATTTGAYAVQATAQRLDRNDRQRRAAVRDNNLVQQLNAVAEASKVRARSPETFEEFVGELAQDGPVDTLYVDAQTFNQTLEDAGIRVTDVEAAVPAVAEQLSNALRDGGDLAIPVEQFAARISGTDFAQPLLDHLRVNPALPSRAEVMALGQEANEALQAEVEAVLTAEVTTDAFRQSAERVKQSLLEQLNTAGRFTKDVNDAYASLPAAYYTVRAAQLGITPEEMAARFPLQIRAELPTAAGGATLDQGEMQELLAAARSRIAAREELVSKLATQSPDGVRLQNGERRALVSRDPSAPGKFRVTFFDAQGPSNHLELGTYEEALQEALKVGFAPETRADFNQSEVPAAPPFYSALARAVAESKTAKAPAAQWKATLAKTAGVKAEELEWSGVNEWLDLQEGPVERQTLQDFLEVGGIQLEETVLGGQGINPDSRYASPTVEAALAGAQTREDAIMQLENDGPAYAILSRRESLRDAETGEMFEDWAELVVDDVWQDASTADGASGPAQYATYKLPGADDTYREFLIRLPNLRGDSFSSAERHFDQFTDVIGHARFTTRTDAEGAKVLFLEEVQSTHHETGREEGYARPVDPAEVAARQAEVDIARGELSVASEKLAAAGQAFLERKAQEQAETGLPEVLARSNYDAAYWLQRINARLDTGNASAALLVRHAAISPGNEFRDELTEAETSAWSEYNEASLRLRERQNALANAEAGPGVARAPWEKSWSQLVMKRMIRYAVDNGYDKVAWINGNQQNGGQTGGDGAWFYERNLVNETNAILKKLGARVEKIEFRTEELLARTTRARASGQEGLRGTERPSQDLGIQNGFVLTDKIKEQAAQGFSLFQARPILYPAVKHDGRVYKSVADHLSALSQIPEVKERKRASAYAERGFVDHRGRFLDRFKAQQYALENDLIREDAPAWARTSPELISENLKKSWQMDQRNRGQIAFAGDITQSPSVISLLRTADLSTFLHETGHYFLEVDAYIASQPDAPAEVVADVNRLLAWFGIEDLATWNAKPVEEKRQFHEQFARGFEMFLLEGRSPTPELQTLFQRFRSWLLNVYKSLTSLNVELTDEVRDVMGRMLASAEAIQNAEDVRHFKPLAESRPPYMTEQAWDEYQRAFAAATAEGLDTLSTRTVRDMKWLANARSRALKRLQAQANDARRQVRAEVTAEVNAEPINRARRFITRGTDENNEPIPGAGKLDLATLREMYGEGEDALWRQLRVGGKYGEAGNDGIHPDVVAENFGFPSGDALVRELIAAENAQEKIAGLTDQRMLERYGDIADEQAMDRATDEAIANDARARVLATEYAALAEATGQPRALAAAARQYAAGIVNRIELKRLKPHQFFAASARAGRQVDAALKKDDLGAAATAKRNQLVNMQAARYTLDAKREVDKALTLYKRILSANDEALAKSRDMALVNATRALLAQYGLTRMKNDPMGYLERVKAYDPQLYADIEVFLKMGPAVAKPFADMTFEEFQGMHEVVRQLWALSYRTRQMEVDGKLVHLNTARKELGDRLDELGEYPQERVGMARAATDKDKRDMSLLSVRASLRRVESWVRAIDAGDNGPFRRYIWNPISEAADRYRAAKGDLIRSYLDIIKDLEGTLTGAKIDATEIGYTFKNRAELLHAVLHTGNQSNLSKLLLGREWGSRDKDGGLDTSRWDAFVSRMWAEGKLTKADYDFAQKVWDLLDSMKPGAQAAHRAVYGRYFSEVTADELVTPFGTYRGGYVPATADAELVADAARRRGQRALEETPSSMFPAASNGFTQSRNEDYTKPLKLDLGLLGGHIDSVLKFTYMAAPVRDAARLLKGDALSDKLFAFDPKAETDLLLPFLSRAALQTVEVPAKTEGGRATARFFRGLRARVGMQLMFANVSNAMQQFTGVFPLALRLKKTQIARAAVFYFKNPEQAAQAVNEKSLFMRNRTSTQMFEVMNEIDDMLLDPSKYDKLRAYATQHAYFLQSFTQNHVDFIAWGGAYDAAISRGEEEKEAIRFADSVIRETQGTLAPEDVAAVETQQAFVRSFLQFYNFFNVMANLNATEVMIVKRTTGLKQGAGRLFYIYMMGFAAQALIADAIAGLFRGGWEDDEDDGYLDEFLIWFFGGQAKFAAAMVPGVGQAANAAIGLATTKAQYDDRVSVSPSVSLFESFIRVPFQAYKSVFEGEDFDRRDVRDTMTLLGVLTKLPIGALGRPVGYGVGVAQGDIQPTGPLDVARGLVTGAPSPESRTN